MSVREQILLAQLQADRNVETAGLASIQPMEAPLAAAAGLKWAKTTRNWHYATGNDSWVDANPCADRDGNTVQTTTTIRIYLPRAPGTDPNVVSAQIIGYIVDSAGANIAAASFLDVAIGTVRMWSKTGALPAGWADCVSGGYSTLNAQGLCGRFPVGQKTGDADFGTYFAIGGQKSHAHNLHRDHATEDATPVWFDEGTANSTHIGDELTSHLPPFYVARFIERIDNST